MNRRTHTFMNHQGFTIIEVIIVLAIASLIIIIVLLAVPNLERLSRNHGRIHDATSLAALISECMNNNGQNNANCHTPAQIGFQPTMFTQFTGVHYGVNWPNTTQAFPPTIDEPSWQFGVQCNAAGDKATIQSSPVAFAVSYLIEAPSNPYGVAGKCLSN